jgi:hypothetical protein
MVSRQPIALRRYMDMQYLVEAASGSHTQRPHVGMLIRLLDRDLT